MESVIGSSGIVRTIGEAVVIRIGIGIAAVRVRVIVVFGIGTALFLTRRSGTSRIGGPIIHRALGRFLHGAAAFAPGEAFARLFGRVHGFGNGRVADGRRTRIFRWIPAYVATVIASVEHVSSFDDWDRIRKRIALLLNMDIA